MKTDQSVYIQQKAINPWLSLSVILLAPLITVIDIFIVNISTPAIKAYYQSSDAAVELVIAAYLVGYAVFLITGSRAGDYYGRKRMFITGLVAFTLTSTICGFAGSIEMLITARFFQGVAAAFTVPQTVTLIQLNFQSSADKDKAYGLYGISLCIGATLGQFLGGYFVSSHWIADSWRLIFLVNLPVGFIAVILAYFFVNESVQNKSTRFDVPGIILLTLALSSLIYPIIQGAEKGWPAWTIVLLISSLLQLILFVLYQHYLGKQQREPLLPLDLFRVRSFNIGIGSVIFFFSAHTAFIFVSAIYIQSGYHLPPLETGYYFMMLSFPFLLSSLWSIKTAARYGIGLLQVGCILMILSFIMQLLLLHTPLLNHYALFACLIVYGLGSGIVMPSLLKVSLRDVPVDKAGAASGVYSTIQQFSSALGVSIIGGIFLYLARHTGIFFTGYKVALYCMTGYLVIVMILLNGLRKITSVYTSPGK
ncbi:MFS transporter [Chitinophaga sp. MM2321]|uniref:MFS transporter n=1 Tax=Chitinophaga sp. MM2321 TaxID=3137178 RepID=UPI0032D58670